VSEPRERLCLEIQGLLSKQLMLEGTLGADQIDVFRRSDREGAVVGPADEASRIGMLRRALCVRRSFAARRRGASSNVFRRSSQMPSRSAGLRALLVTGVRERPDRILMTGSIRAGR